ncbi:MAG: hypothetical protein V3T23_08220 [Nitrososphaerales archaeon]
MMNKLIQIQELDSVDGRYRQVNELLFTIESTTGWWFWKKTKQLQFRGQRDHNWYVTNWYSYPDGHYIQSISLEKIVNNLLGEYVVEQQRQKRVEKWHSNTPV